MKMVGISSSALTDSRWRSSPLIPGNLISVTRQPAASGRSLLINAVADPKSSTCKPTDSTRRLMARRTDASSSTTKTTGAGSVIYCDRESELEQSAPRGRQHGQLPATRFYDRTADGKPHADAFRLRSKEWFEDA